MNNLKYIKHHISVSPSSRHINLKLWETHGICSQFSSVQSLSHVWLFATPWTAARQASLSVTNSWSSLRFTSIESVMPSSHLILRRPLFLLPPIPPSNILPKWHRYPCYLPWSGRVIKEAGSGIRITLSPIPLLQDPWPPESYLSLQPKFIMHKIRTKTSTHQIGLLCGLNPCYSKGESWTRRVTIAYEVVKSVEIFLLQWWMWLNEIRRSKTI